MFEGGLSLMKVCPRVGLVGLLVAIPFFKNLFYCGKNISHAIYPPNRTLSAQFRDNVAYWRDVFVSKVWFNSDCSSHVAGFSPRVRNACFLKTGSVYWLFWVSYFCIPISGWHSFTGAWFALTACFQQRGIWLQCISVSAFPSSMEWKCISSIYIKL